MKKLTKKRQFSAGLPRIDTLFVISMSFLAVFVAFVIMLIFSSLFYTKIQHFQEVFCSPVIRAAMRLSVKTSTISLIFVMLISIPTGYALSRYRFPGHTLATAIVCLPILLPHIVVGAFLLAFFQVGVGKWLESHGLQFVYAVKGIILCQFVIAVSYAIVVCKAAFDAVDRRLERVALTLGCSSIGAFRKVTFPLAGNGIISAAIIAWTASLGLYGPIMIFAGAVRMKTEVMPTTIYLEFSVGRIEIAFAVTLVMLAITAVALAVLFRLIARLRIIER